MIHYVLGFPNLIEVLINFFWSSNFLKIKLKQMSGFPSKRCACMLSVVNLLKIGRHHENIL